MSQSIEGKITEVEQVVELKSGNQKRDFVITTEGEYPQEIKFTLFGEKKVNVITPEKVGSKALIHYDIRGNRWEGKVFNNLNCWKVDFLSSAEPLPTSDGMGDLPKEGDLPF